jgi:hypothetical protein
MVLYCLIGFEILKRRHAIKAISSDSIPVETVVSRAHESCSDEHCTNTTTMTPAASVYFQHARAHTADDVGKDTVCAHLHSTCVDTP